MDDIRAYLNQVGWSTITVLAERFSITRHDVTVFLTFILREQDVRIYGGEIVHV